MCRWPAPSAYSISRRPCFCDLADEEVAGLPGDFLATGSFVEA